jgi:acyl-CoA thioesterase
VAAAPRALRRRGVGERREGVQRLARRAREREVELPRFGAAPFTRSDDPEVGGWLALREDRPIDAPAACVLADAWYSAVWARLDALHPAPTIDLTVHFRAPLPQARAAARALSHDARPRRVLEEDGELWARDGTLVAQSRQLGLLLAPSG